MSAKDGLSGIVGAWRRGRFSGLASGVAVLFSGYSLYATSLKQPDIQVFVPPVIQYASPGGPNSNFEVFAIPVTLTNDGARTGTVLSMELTVADADNKQVKRFYGGHFGVWTAERARAFQFKPFAPLSLAGHSSQSDSVLFYPRNDEKVLQLVTATGVYHFTLQVTMAEVRHLGIVDRWWWRAPVPTQFDMVLPALDHRAFQTGTLPMHQKEWQTTVGGN